MSFFKKLFGGAGAAPEEPKAAATQEHAGFVIHATPFREGGQYQLAGAIEKDVDGTRRRQEFIRADRFTDRDEAVQFTFAKGRQIIDEQGEKLFRQA